MSMIRLEAVGKRYQLVHERPMLVRSLFHAIRRRSVESFWALEDVNFASSADETLGVIGRNGSGKTTLLRLLAGVTSPTTGRVRVEGRIAPLIGVGVGFNAELSGRENIFVNGRMLGLTKAEIEARFDDICEFSELGSFVDTAVKNYSSGMFLRLAFAIAIHVEPDVMLVDELLAVGDFAFQRKCLARMRELQSAGTSLVVVTHNMETVQRMCQRVVVLHNGRAVFDGPPNEAIDAYHDVLHGDPRSVDTDELLRDDEAIPVVGGAHVVAEILDATGHPGRHINTGDTWAVRARATFEQPVSGPVFGVAISQPTRGLLYVVSTAPGDYVASHGPDRPLETTITLRNHLLPGTYFVRVAILDPSGRVALGVSRSAEVTVSSTRRDAGVVDMEGRITVGGFTIGLSERPTMSADGDDQAPSSQT